jgi:hypothetical protein
VVAAVICLQKRSRFRSHSACLHAARCLSHAFKLWVRLTFSVSFTWSDIRLPPTAQRQFPLKNGACDCSLCLHDMTSRLFARQTFQLPLIPTPERPKHLSSTSTLPLLFAYKTLNFNPIINQKHQPRHYSHASKGYQEEGGGANQDSPGELHPNRAFAYVALTY